MKTPERIADRRIVTTAVFRPYDMRNSEIDMHAHDNERVEVLGSIPLDHEEFEMFRVRFPDGDEGQAFDDELTDWKDEG